VQEAHRSFSENPNDKKLQLLHQGCIQFNNRNIYLGVPSSPTTNKRRIITTQLAKILQPVAATIDWCFVVTPENSSIPVTIRSIVRVGDQDPPVGKDGLIPSYWCSDHFMVESEITVGHERYRVGTLNILGGSMSTGKAYQHFEFIPEEIYQKLVQRGLKEKIESILQNFLEEFTSELKDPNSPNREVLDKIIDRFFVKRDKAGTVIKVVDINPDNIKLEKVFGLKDAGFLNIHVPDFIDEDTKAAYAEAYNNTKLSPEDDLLAKRCQDFFNRLYYEPELYELFKEWYASLSAKKSFDTILTEYFRRDRNQFDAFALQEVAVPAMVKILQQNPRFSGVLQRSRFPGYKVHIQQNSNTNKTTGALIIKDRPPRYLQPLRRGAEEKTEEEKRKFRRNVIITVVVIIVIVVVIVSVVLTEKFKANIVDPFINRSRSWFTVWRK
jgi:hypothetical protein